MTDLVRALKGALDYTRLYRNQTFVLKLGGEVLARREAVDDLAVQIALLESLSIRVVVVHGGGPQASDLSRRLGIEPRIVAGRRVTTPQVMDLAKMVFAGTIRTDLLSVLRSHGVRAVGISGIDGDLITAVRRPPVEVRDDDGSIQVVDYGEVGDIVRSDTDLVETLIAKSYVPVIASLAADEDGRALNINADTVAETLASVLRAKKLIFLTRSPGLLRDPDDPASLIAFAGPEDLEALLATGTIRAGMRPKVEACIRAVRSGVRRTHIIDGLRPDSLLVEVFTGVGSGTMIASRNEKREYEEHEL